MIKILCCGDSWTHGYGVDEIKRWTDHLPNTIVTNASQEGANNFEIKDQAFLNLEHDTDVLIVGWSGVTRYAYKENTFDFCWAEDFQFRNSFFETKTLQEMEQDFVKLNEEINSLCETKGVKLIKFSVFGDFKYLWDKYYTEKSFLDFLSIKQGHKFKYQIPFFEFDFLSEENYKNTKTFAKKYFPKHWDRAIVERNDIRPGKYFLDCGHPNELGHQAWAEYIEQYL